MATVLNWPASGAKDHLLADGAQQQLARWNQHRLSPRLPDPDWRLALDQDQAMLGLEASLLPRLLRNRPPSYAGSKN
jgi:hypothetical protein